jgi:molecular chaperone IbpA
MVNAYFKDLLPSTVGFDRMFSTLETVNDILTNTAVKTPSYPPYNIVKTGDNTYTIEMAVAGFTMENIEITLEDSLLTVTGNKKESDETVDYLYRGIALRNFTRSFTLADTVEVKGADIVNGLLVISLENIIPEAKKPKKIPIGTKKLLQE